MKIISNACFKIFTAAAHRVATQGLVLGGSGNLSWRVSRDRMLITTTGAWMSKLSRKTVAVCRINDAATLDGNIPSKEIGFHTGIMRERANVNVVLHCNSAWATAIACREPPIRDFNVIPEIPYYIGPVAAVPFLAPGSDQLAQSVISAMREHELAILRNHGQVVLGKDFDEALARAAYFELACHIILATGGNVQHLSKSAVADLRHAVKAK